jgi:hypothetical protein
MIWDASTVDISRAYPKKHVSYKQLNVKKNAYYARLCNLYDMNITFNAITFVKLIKADILSY